MLKILHYYWSQYYDTGKMGGGIQVYLNNIIKEQVKGNIVYTLSSGTEYDLSGKCKICKVNAKNSVTEDYTIVNSPMLAPSKASFYDLYKYMKDEILKNVLKDFLHKKGPFDVIHIHSFEGLTLSCLELKKEFPNTKFILSLHNYYSFCPQVNLWCENKKNCIDYNDGERCLNCGAGLPVSSIVKKGYIVNTYLKRLGMTKVYQKTLSYCRKTYKKIYRKRISKNAVEKTIEYSPLLFKKFREKNVQYINKYVDSVICVSSRVKDIATGFGVDTQKCKVLYIGTNFASKQLNSPVYTYDGGYFSIIYMGYMRHDKGFYFLLECLKRIPISISKQLRVIIAARHDDIDAVLKLKDLRNRFKAIDLYNGYTHENIHEIINGCNLGIVPVMWEDNLPQVSMELKAMGIPVLSSNLGGASELTKCDAFCFQAGDCDSFITKLKNIIDNPVLLQMYYKEGFRLNTIDEHCCELDNIYIL